MTTGVVTYTSAPAAQQVIFHPADQLIGKLAIQSRREPLVGLDCWSGLPSKRRCRSREARPREPDTPVSTMGRQRGLGVDISNSRHKRETS